METVSSRNPGLEGQPYRTIAAKAGVALGMVNRVMGELKELGFLVEVGEGRAGRKHLVQKEKLLERGLPPMRSSSGPN